MTEEEAISTEAMDSRLNAEQLKAFTKDVFERAGLPKADAEVAADNLVAADLGGVHSHGVMRLPWYVDGLEKGAVKARPDMRRVRQRRSTGLLDGGNGLGMVVGHQAMAWAVEMAAAEGVGVVGVCHSNHFGAAAYFARQALERDFIGIAMTNGGPIMAPWGGKKRMLGNHPMAFAIPAGEELPVVLDIATSVVAHGKIALAAKTGASIPEGWALDKEGRPTTDAKAGEEGFVMPMGGYKGYGLSLVVGILSAVLSGAALGWEMLEIPEAYNMHGVNIGHFFLALDVESFIELGAFKQHMDEIIRELKACPKAEGVERIYLPGEIEHLREERYRREGIPIPGAVMGELQDLAGRLEVPFPF